MRYKAGQGCVKAFIPVEIIASQLGDIYIMVLNPDHPREAISDVAPEDIKVFGNRMLHGWDEDVFFFACGAECLEEGLG